MKKILISVFIALCVFTAVGLNINSNKSAGALEEDNLTITTNYNDDGLLNFKIYDSLTDLVGEINSYEFELVYSGDYPDISKIEITVYEYYEGILGGHVELADITTNNGNVSGPISGNGGIYTINNLNLANPIDISIDFNVEEFDISSECVNKFGGEITNLDNEFINWYTSGDDINTVKYGQKLYVEVSKNITKTSGGEELSFDFENLYFFKYFANDMFLANSISETDSIVKYEFIINYDFSLNYTQNKKIELIARYVQSYKLNLNYNANLIVGNPVIKNKDTNEQITNLNQFFNSGINLQITVDLLDYVELKKLADERWDIGGVIEDVNVEGKKIIIDVAVINQNLNITINLGYTKYTVNPTGDRVTFDKPEFVYGDKIRITSLIESNSKELKTWIINNITVPGIGKTKDGITRINKTTVEIDTKVWYEKFGLNFNSFTSKITAGMKTSMILAITIPISVAVLAVLILMLIMLQHAKTKKKIRILLEKQKQMEYTYNAGSMIEDLREDTYNKVTEEDIKAEMKKKKDHKDE